VLEGLLTLTLGMLGNKRTAHQEKSGGDEQTGGGGHGNSKSRKESLCCWQACIHAGSFRMLHMLLSVAKRPRYDLTRALVGFAMLLSKAGFLNKYDNQMEEKPKQDGVE